MSFDLSHLTQGESEDAWGPIQDSEALLLYAICRIGCFRRVIEFGGLYGYSATNFLRAMGPEGKVYSVEMNDMTPVAPNHIHVHKQAGEVLDSDFDWLPVDLVFFDVHHLGQQMSALLHLEGHGIITDQTVIALHDTGMHPEQIFGWAVPMDGKWVHQQIERKMSNILKDRGYEGLSFDCLEPPPPLRFRHGITILKKRSRFKEPPTDLVQTICIPGVMIDGPMARGLDSQGRVLSPSDSPA